MFRGHHKSNNYVTCFSLKRVTDDLLWTRTIEMQRKWGELQGMGERGARAIM